MKWTDEQEAVFARFAEPSLGNTVVIARAGTGKTTTICEGIKSAPERRRRSGVLFAAFNRRIAEELKGRVPTGVKVTTIHGLGYQACARRLGDFVVSEERGLRLAESVVSDSGRSWSPSVRRQIVNGVRTLASKGKVTLSTTVSALLECVNAFDVELPPDIDMYQFISMAQAAMQLAATKTPRDKVLDYDDMLWLPFAMDLPGRPSDLVVVDESQDLSAAQLYLLKKSIGGRLLAVGDPAQAIYGFAGADSSSMSRITSEMSATELGLLTTFRCPKKVVEIAQHYVPDYRPGPANAEGCVESIAFADLKHRLAVGDFVLSRTNAGAVKAAFECVRARLPVVVIGRDFGRGLRARFDAAVNAVGGFSLRQVADHLRDWYSGEKERVLVAYGDERAAAKIDRLVDEQLALEEILRMGESIDEVRAIIGRIFADDPEGAAVNCSTVHRAKGLEGHNVFLLGATFAPSEAEGERNLRYVAVTRAQRRLVFVGSADKASDDGTGAFSGAISPAIRAEWLEARRAASVSNAV